MYNKDSKNVMWLAVKKLKIMVGLHQSVS